MKPLGMPSAGMRSFRTKETSGAHTVSGPNYDDEARVGVENYSQIIGFNGVANPYSRFYANCAMFACRQVFIVISSPFT